MRDARLLVWLFADPARAVQLSAAQIDGVRRVAAAEGLSADLSACLSGQSPSVAPERDVAAAICQKSTDLLGRSALRGGLREIWHINLLLRQEGVQPDFWAALLAASRQQGCTRHVSRAMRLCYHLFEAPVDPFLAWQGQWADIFFIGRLLARDGQGRETARVLRLAFIVRALWLNWRAGPAR